MTRSSTERISRLETTVSAWRCKHCRSETRLVEVDPDTGVEISANRPDVCPACGRTIEGDMVIRLVGIDPDDI